MAHKNIGIAQNACSSRSLSRLS